MHFYVSAIWVSFFTQARVNDELLMYELFPYHAVSDVENRLKLRFKKYNHGLIIGRKKPTAARAKAGPEVDTSEEDRRSRMHWLKPFDDISGYSGVCVKLSVNFSVGILYVFIYYCIVLRYWHRSIFCISAAYRHSETDRETTKKKCCKSLYFHL
jgi:hypothetical protein